jgi:hypothetical protein
MKLPVEKTKGDTVMADNLQSKIRCAAVAGWWTLLIAVAHFSGSMARLSARS